MDPAWRLGEPTYLTMPQGRRGSHGDIVGEVAEMMRRPLDPHQLLAVDAISSYQRGGAWLAPEVCVIGPRQVTGKTSGIVLPCVLADLMTWSEPDRAVWSSHRMKTTMDTVRDLSEIIEGSEEFSRRVRKFSVKDDDAALYLTNGAWIDFVARSAGAGRGLAAGEVVDDEALYFTDSMAGDLLPTMASRRNPRLLHASSAPKAESSYLHSLMKRGRAGDPALIYVEFRAPGSHEDPGCERPDCPHEPGTPGCALDDEDRWLFAAPSVVSGRSQVSTIRMLRGSMPPREFAREMLGWEEAPESGGAPITVEMWQLRADPAGQIEGTPVLGLDVSPNRATASIGLAGWRPDGLAQVELVRSGPGDGWVLPEMRRAFAAGMRCVALDGKSQAVTFRAELESIGFAVSEMTAGEQSAACMGLERDVKAPDRLRHLESESGALTQALRGAAARSMGDGGGWAWARKTSDADITGLVAVTAARWLLVEQGPADPLDNIW